MMLKLLDLFSGIGGFSLAAHWTDSIETIGFCEIDPFCSQVLQKNFKNITNFGDIKGMPLWNEGVVDIITAGIPCQPFSVAGKRKGREDERHLYPYVSRVILAAKPKWVIIENVVGIVEMELDNILDDLENQNYTARSFIIPACASNAPHRRDRIWIIANLNGERCDDGFSDRKIRHIQENIERNMASIQQEWEELKPKSWKTYTARDWFHDNSRVWREGNGISTRVDRDRLKALGNSIVPQVAYVFLKLIAEIELNAIKK